MKYIRVLLFFASFAITQIGYSQKNTEIDLEQLRIPTAPAAIIIDLQPNEVNKPKSMKDLEAALIRNYVGENNALSIPNNMMLEAMPYWLGDRKNVDVIKDYLNEDLKNLFWKNLSLSVASTQNFRISDSLNTNALGFGFRTLLRRGDLFSDHKTLIKVLQSRSTLARLNVIIGTLIDDIDDQGITTNTDFIQRIKTQYQSTRYYLELDVDVRKAIDEVFIDIEKSLPAAYTGKDAIEGKIEEYFNTVLTKETEKIKSLYNRFRNDRKGLQLELAGALALNFPTNETDFSTVPKYGIWLTGTFNPDEETKSDFRKHTSLILMSRFIRNDVGYYQRYFVDSIGYYQNNFDLGGRIIYQKNKFSVEAEFLGRYRRSMIARTKTTQGDIITITRNDWDYKYVFNFNYAISPNVVINYSFGKQLEPTLKVNGTLISSLGLNIGFGGPKITPE
jgi:hypothetical protein